MEDQPTELISKDFDKFLEILMNSEINIRKCWNCSKEFFPNYNFEECDECYFSRFPKDQVEKFYRSFFE